MELHEAIQHYRELSEKCPDKFEYKQLVKWLTRLERYEKLWGKLTNDNQ